MSEKDIRLKYAQKVLAMRQRQYERAKCAELPEASMESFQYMLWEAEMEVELLENQA